MLNKCEEKAVPKIVFANHLVADSDNSIVAIACISLPRFSSQHVGSQRVVNALALTITTHARNLEPEGKDGKTTQKNVCGCRKLPDSKNPPGQTYRI